MTWRSGNPVLKPESFGGVATRFDTDAMTIGGTVNKTAMSLAILLFAAGYVWNRGATDPSVLPFVMGGCWGGS